MKLFILISSIILNETAYDLGHRIGYIIGKVLPIVVLVLLLLFLYRKFNKRK